MNTTQIDKAMDFLYTEGHIAARDIQSICGATQQEAEEVIASFQKNGLINRDGKYTTPLVEQSKWKYVGRWVAVLPAAIASMIAATFVSNVALSFQLAYIGASSDSFFATLNKWMIGPAIAAAAFVYFGSKTAPTHRKVVALVLGAIMSITVTVGMISTISIDGDIFKMFLTAICSLFAAGYIIYSFFEHGEEFDLFIEN